MVVTMTCLKTEGTPRRRAEACPAASWAPNFRGFFKYFEPFASERGLLKGEGQLAHRAQSVALLAAGGWNPFHKRGRQAKPRLSPRDPEPSEGDPEGAGGPRAVLRRPPGQTHRPVVQPGVPPIPF